MDRNVSGVKAEGASGRLRDSQVRAVVIWIRQVALEMANV